MRQLKFRAYNRSAEVWVENLSEQEIGYLEIPSIYTKIMQFTGLLDKNGVEIYEGDVVSHSQAGALTIQYIQNKCKFEAVKVRDDSLSVMYNLTRNMATKRLEIIGNIYQNPELLEEK